MTLPFATAFGLIVGSYLNVVVYRVPRGMSTVRPASRCPRCVMPIRAFDNIPVLGYLWLLARCRDCGLPISPRYPLVEAATGAWFALVHMRADGFVEHVAASLLGAFLLVLALIDFDHRAVPVLPTLIVTLLGIIGQIWLGWSTPSVATPSVATPSVATPSVATPSVATPSAADLLAFSGNAVLIAFITALVGALGVLAIARVGRIFGVEEGLALGDAFVLAMIGAVLGPRGLVVAFLLGGALAILIYAPRLALGRRALEQRLPFVTFLAMGAAAALLMGPLAVQSPW